jgi:hypothetical protein
LWTAAIPGAYLPIASDGVVYVGSSDTNLYALDAQTGTVKWKFPTGAAFTSMQIPAISGGVVYIPGADGILYGVDKSTGQELWRYAGVAPFGPVVIAGGRVIVSDSAFTLYCFTPATPAVAPSVTSLAPSRVGNAASVSLTIAGLGFTGANSVQLNDSAGTKLTGFRVSGDSTIASATLPSGMAPGRYQVIVTTPAGRSVDGPELEVAPAGSFLPNTIGLSQGPYDHGTDHPFQRHLARLSDGTLIAAYSGRQPYGPDGGDLFMNYAVSRDGGLTWSRPMALDPGGPDAFVRWAASFTIAVAQGSLVQAVFSQWPSYQQTFSAYTYNGSDYLATAPKLPVYISGQPNFPGPSVTDGAGKIWVAYVLGSDIYVSSSTDGGVTWTQSAKINQNPAGPPALILYNSAPLIVYGQNGGLAWSAWNGTQWSVPQAVPGSPSGVNDNLSLTATSDGRIHLAAAGSSGLQYFNFKGIAWSGATVLDAGATMPSLTSNGADLWCFYVTASSNIAFRRWRSALGSWDAAVAVTNDSRTNTRPGVLVISPDSTVPVIWTVGSGIPYEIHSAAIPVQTVPAALEVRVDAAPPLVLGTQGGLSVSILGGVPPYNSNSPASRPLTFTKAGNFQFSVNVGDSAGATATVSATVSVAQVPATVKVMVPPGPLAANVTYTVTAAVMDQFGDPMILPPPIYWSLQGPRATIDSNGLFTPQQGGDYQLLAYILGGGPTGSLTVTVAPPGTLAPVLSNIARSAITPNSATIQWTTNDPADSQVEYGLDTSYGQLSPLLSSLTTAHSVVLSDLQAGRVYHYRVHSKNASGKEAVSSDLTFTTARAVSGGPGR